MTRNELVKMAYAYGASVALQEAGVDQYQAENAGIKLAEEADAAPPQEDGTLDEMAKRKLMAKILKEKMRFSSTAGMLGGGALGAGAGALLGDRLGGGGRGMGALLGGGAGAALGRIGGKIYGSARHSGPSRDEASSTWDEMRSGKNKGIAPLNLKDLTH